MQINVLGVNEVRELEARVRREEQEYSRALQSNMRKALNVFRELWRSKVDQTFSKGTSHGPEGKAKPSNWPKLRQTIVHTKFEEDTLSGRVIAAPYWYAVTQEYSRTIKPIPSRNPAGRLTVRLSDGTWRKPKEVTVPARPFISDVGSRGEARAIAILGQSFEVFTG